jgi:DNA-binding CsgD family transcriptional regulator
MSMMERQTTCTTNGETSQQAPVFTAREQEIMKELLAGNSPKEIGYTLNISYNTVLGHQRKLYRKLGINTIRELLAKYSAINQTVETPPPGPRVVFTRWITNVDNSGSCVEVTEKVEHIQEQYFDTITIEGKLSHANHAYAGTHAYPDPPTHETMKKMKSFSFKVLGDGNCYAVMLPTTETRLKSDNNHYRKAFTTKAGEIQIVTVNIEELAQSPFWGNPVPFIQDNIEFFQIHAHATRNFCLKFWDVRFYK